MNPLISTAELANRLGEPALSIVDVRWYLGRPGEGRKAYESGHIPDAVHLDVDHDLSDHSDPSRGRHPLPSPEAFVEALARVGIGQGCTIVAYDDAGGTIAARLWWMLKWIGVKQALVLDGGITAWIADGRRIEGGVPIVKRPKRLITPEVRNSMIAAKGDMIKIVDRMKSVIPDDGVYPLVTLDARAKERYRGETEPVDARAGHIPYALNAPAANNTKGETQRFKSPDELHQYFTDLGVRRDNQVVCYCGSGVTACHNVLALTLAGFDHCRLYVGSFSEWSRDSTLPVDTQPKITVDVPVAAATEKTSATGTKATPLTLATSVQDMHSDLDDDALIPEGEDGDEAAINPSVD